MNLLLDTHAFLWWLGGDRMEADAVAGITDPANFVAVSAASVWEIAVKRATGKLRLQGSVTEHVERGGFEPLPISPAHAERAGELPPHHHDPVDRVLIAQAQAEGFRLVTRDPAFEAYDVKLLRC